jgi:predicted nucleic acid-binding protein
MMKSWTSSLPRRGKKPRARGKRGRGGVDKPRVVFDCNVFLQAAARKKGAAAKCLDLAEAGRVQLFVSREVLAEVEDVLNRPEIQAHFSDLSDEIAGAFLKRLQ